MALRQLSFSCSDTELAMIDVIAEKCGNSRSEFLRRAAVDVAKATLHAIMDMDAERSEGMEVGRLVGISRRLRRTQSDGLDIVQLEAGMKVWAGQKMIRLEKHLPHRPPADQDGEYWVYTTLEGERLLDNDLVPGALLLPWVPPTVIAS